MSSAVRRHSSATKASPVPAVSTATVPASRGGRCPLSGRSTSMRACKQQCDGVTSRRHCHNISDGRGRRSRRPVAAVQAACSYLFIIDIHAVQGSLLRLASFTDDAAVPAAASACMPDHSSRVYRCGCCENAHQLTVVHCPIAKSARGHIAACRKVYRICTSRVCIAYPSG